MQIRAITKLSKEYFIQFPRFKSFRSGTPLYSNADSEKSQQESRLFNEAYSHERDKDLGDDSPIKAYFNKERYIEQIKIFTQYLNNPHDFESKYLENKKPLFKQNFTAFKNCGFEFEVKGLLNNQQQQNVIVKQALFQYTNGLGSIPSNQVDQIQLSNLESHHYLSLQKDQTVMKVGNNEHFAIFLEDIEKDNYCAALKENQLIIHNLSPSISKEEIEQLFQKEQIKAKVQEIKLDVLQRPAFAVVNVASKQVVQDIINRWHGQQYLLDRLMDIRSLQNSVYESPYNRTLVIQEISQFITIQDILLELAEFGFIIKFELVEAATNPNLPEQQDLDMYLQNNNNIFQQKESSQQSQHQGQDLSGSFNSGIEVNYLNPLMGKSFKQINTKGIQRREGQEGEEDQQSLEKHSVADVFKKVEDFHKQREEGIVQQLKEKTPFYCYDWDISGTSQQEQVFRTLTPQFKTDHQQNIRSRRQYQHLGYCFVNFASTDQAKLAYSMINSKRMLRNKIFQWKALLKGDTDHWYYDTNHLFQNLKDIMNKQGSQSLMVDDKSKELRENQTLEEAKDQIKNKLMEQYSDYKYNEFLKIQIQDMVLSPKDYSWQSKYLHYLDLSKLGRNFGTSPTIRDVEKFQEEILGDFNEKKNVEENLRKESNLNILDDYENEIMQEQLLGMSDAEQIKRKAEQKLREQLILEHQQQVDQEKLSQWENKAKGMMRSRQRKEQKREYHLQKKLEQLTGKEQGQATPDNGEDKAKGKETEKGKEKEKEKEKGEAKPDSKVKKSPVQASPTQKNKKAFFDPTDQSNLDAIAQKKFKYLQFLQTLQALLKGSINEQEKKNLFEGDGLCRDIQGNLYMDTDEAKRVRKYLLPLDKEMSEKIQKEWDLFDKGFESLPDKWKESINNPTEAEQAKSINIIFQSGFPESSFTPELSEGQTIEQYLRELNLYSVELGEEFILSKDKDGKEVVLKIIKPYCGKQKNEFNRDGVIISARQMLLSEFGFSPEEIEQEIVFFLLNGKFSAHVLSFVQRKIDSNSAQQLQEISAQLNVSLAELEISLLSAFQDPSIIMRSVGIKQYADLLAKQYGEPKKEDYIQYDQNNFKNEAGKFQTSKVSEA